MDYHGDLGRRLESKLCIIRNEFTRMCIDFGWISNGFAWIDTELSGFILIYVDLHGFKLMWHRFM